MLPGWYAIISSGPIAYTGSSVLATVAVRAVIIPVKWVEKKREKLVDDGE